MSLDRLLVAVRLTLLFGVILGLGIRAGEIESLDIAHEVDDLLLWGSNEPIEPFVDGEIVILDFFAHWCGPCLPISKEVEQLPDEISGEKIRVMPINVEKRYPEKTSRFIKRAGLSQVYFDPKEVLAKKLGVVSLPAIVVAIARVTNHSIEIVVVEELDPSLLEGRIREEIETLLLENEDDKGERVLSADKQAEGPVDPHFEIGDSTDDRISLEASSPPVGIPPFDGSHAVVETVSSQLSHTFESYSTSDIIINNIGARIEIDGQNNWVGAVSFSRNVSKIDYSPSSRDLIGSSIGRDEASDQISIDLERLNSRVFSSLYSLSFYDGYTDFRSVWLDEFYRQQFEPVEGYQKATPGGYSALLGGRYEYLPSTAFADVVLGYQFDRISPAYEAAPFQPLRRGLSEVNTYFLRASTENLVTNRLRVRQQLQFADTTDRAVRISYTSDLNFAVNESIVLKGSLGLTKEASDFDSNHLGFALEKDIGHRVVISLFGRKYEDSGEVVDPRIVSTAAPALDTDRYGLSVNWANEQFDLNFQVGKYRIDYESVPDISFQFENLYRDRDWNFFRLSGLFHF